MNEGEGGEIALRDQVLELMYWLEGEGFPEHTTVAGLARFLMHSEAEVGGAVARLIDRGDLTPVDGGHRLTATGRREAARRFAEEFAPLLKQGHGECNDPECDCHEGGAAECHIHS